MKTDNLLNNENIPKHKLTFKPENEFYIKLRPDFCSIAWTALKKNTFLGTSVKENNIYLTPGDYVSLYSSYLLYVLLILITIILLVRGIILDSTYYVGDWKMIVLRMILITFAHKLISPEFLDGYYKVIYTISHPNKFVHKEFAVLIGICEMVITTISIISILLWICMANQYIQPVSGFAALSVITCFNDWIGSVILMKTIKDNKKISKENRIKVMRDLRDYTKGLINTMNIEEIYMSFDDNSNINDENDNIDIEKGNMISQDLGIEVENEKMEEYYIKNINQRMGLFDKLSLLDMSNERIKISNRKYFGNHIFNIVYMIRWDFIIALSVIPVSLYMPEIQGFVLKYFHFNEQ